MDTDISESGRVVRTAVARAATAPTRLERRDFAARLGPTAGAWGIGLVVTALILTVPAVSVSSRGTSPHLVLSTADACIAIFAAYLMHGRYRRRQRHRDLLLAQGLILLGIAGLGLAWGGDLSQDPALGRFAIWLPLLVRALGAVLIVAAALAPRQWTTPKLLRWRTVLVPLGLGALAAAFLLLLRDRLPAVLESADQGPRPQVLAGHPALLLTEGAAAVLLLVASVAFGLQASRREDPLFRLLGPAFAFLGFARINFLLFPSVYTQWVYSGDALRTACYAVLLFGAFREVQQYWSAQTQIAVLDDRRRLARELHDGVVQELAYIRAEAAELAHTLPVAQEMVSAADRGLDEARAALQALGSPGDEPLSFTLHRAAREVSSRYGVELEVDLDDQVQVTHDQKHALMRITREAISNAARHGGCTKVLVRLGRNEHGRLLLVDDDGAGFDPTLVAATSAGFGLTSMRERAQALPGDLTIDSRPGVGTTVRLQW